MTAVAAHGRTAGGLEILSITPEPTEAERAAIVAAAVARDLARFRRGNDVAVTALALRGPTLVGRS